jgi:hypothetical protein
LVSWLLFYLFADVDWDDFIIDISWLSLYEYTLLSLLLSSSFLGLELVDKITLLISFNPWIVLRVLDPVELWEATLTVDIKCFALLMGPESQFERTAEVLPFFAADTGVSLSPFIWLILLANCKLKLPGKEFFDRDLLNE